MGAGGRRWCARAIGPGFSTFPKREDIDKMTCSICPSTNATGIIMEIEQVSTGVLASLYASDV